MTKKKFHGSRKRKDLWVQGELEGSRFGLWREPPVSHRFGSRKR
jgi:hypothetical protein